MATAFTLFTDDDICRSLGKVALLLSMKAMFAKCHLITYLLVYNM